MALTFSLEKNGLLCEVSGDVDHHSAKLLRDEMDKALERYMPENLYIDLSGVSFMDSSGIGLVLGRYRNQANRGGKTAVIVPEGRIRRILTMAAADKLVALLGSKEEI